MGHFLNDTLRVRTFQLSRLIAGRFCHVVDSQEIGRAKRVRSKLSSDSYVEKMAHLPEIIGVPAPIPVLAGELKDVLIKQFILCITRDLSAEDRALFRDYHLTDYDDQIHKNIPIEHIRFDVLVVDLREKGDRYAYMRHILPHKDRYHTIIYCHGFEIEDLEIPHENAFSSFPARQARKEDFEYLLLMKRIAKPRWYISLLSCIFSIYRQSR